MSRFIHNRHRETLAAFALIAAGLTGTIVDDNGRAGLALFVAGAGGVIFLVGRQLARSLGPKVAAANAHRRRRTPRGSVPKLVSGRTVAIAVVAMCLLLSSTNVFKATVDDALSRALNYGAWYGVLLLAISVVGVVAVTGARWFKSPSTAPRRRVWLGRERREHRCRRTSALTLLPTRS